jgi:hypothetical protein
MYAAEFSILVVPRAGCQRRISKDPDRSVKLEEPIVKARAVRDQASTLSTCCEPPGLRAFIADLSVVEWRVPAVRRTPTGRNPVRFLPPRFPQLWKTLWKSRECRVKSSRNGDFLRLFPVAKAAKARVFVFLSSHDCCDGPWSSSFGGESPLPLDFSLYCRVVSGHRDGCKHLGTDPHPDRNQG